MVVVFGVMFLIFLVLVAIIVWAATNNRTQNYQMGPGYVDQGMMVDDTPLIAGMIAADIAVNVAEDIAFAGGQQQMMGGMDQGQQFFDSQDNGMGGGDMFSSDQGFDDSSSGFDTGGGGDF